MLKQEWIVQLVIEATHEYTVAAASEEEAIALAEKAYQNGDIGSRLGFDVQTADGFCGDEEEEYD